MCVNGGSVCRKALDFGSSVASTPKLPMQAAPRNQAARKICLNENGWDVHVHSCSSLRSETAIVQSWRFPAD